jgi:hypothetical protein
VPESDPPHLSIAEAIIPDGKASAGEKNFGQRRRNAMLRAIGLILRPIELKIHRKISTPKA